MRLPVISGIIRRRLLLNFRVDPGVIAHELPPTFVPKVHDGFAIAGICLIRLESIRPRLLPAGLGVSSENAAHRIAVQWQSENDLREGVFIPRRDSSSLLNQLAGGRLFPGEHHAARFRVSETPDSVELRMNSNDGDVSVHVAASISDRLPSSSVFSSVDDASRFFEPGSLGYSATHQKGVLHGVVLRTKTWLVEPLLVHEIESSYFSDRARFPEGSIAFDHGLIMRNIEHEWQGASDLYVENGAA